MNAVRRRLAPRRSWLLPAAQWAAIVLAAWCGWQGYQEADRERTGINEAVVYFAVAIALVAFFAWDGKFPSPRTWPSRTVAYVRAHPVELGVLAIISAVGVFVRLWQYGTLPPAGYLDFEEHIYAGVGWDVLQGARPYQYPTYIYSSALSQELFGPSTYALRAPSVTAGIITIPLFYLMVREVMQRPAALFATAIFCSLRLFADTFGAQQTLFISEIALVWMLLRALNTGVILWLVPAAVLAGLLGYEYETAKALPIFIAPFLVWVAFRAMVWPVPRTIGTVGNRIRVLGPNALKGAVVIAVILAISVGPIIAESHRGRNIYFASLDRQRGDREARGTPGLFAPNWEKQLKWSVQVYTPSVQPGYPVIGNMPKRGAVDKITSVMIWAGVIWGVLFFWRGYRALFIGWFIGGMIMSSLLLSTWAPWKVLGWLPPAIVLVGLLADDVIGLAHRRDKRIHYAIAGLLAVVVASVLVLNLQVMRANARDKTVMQEYGNNASQLYNVCRHLGDRGDDAYGVVAQRARPSWGFSEPPPEGFVNAGYQWSDWRFVCSGLVGQTTSGLQEFWPYYPDLDRPYSLIQIAAPYEAGQVVSTLATVMPELGPPATREESPGGRFESLVWDATKEQLTARRGLMLRWFDADGELLDEAIAEGPLFTLEAPADANSYELTGLLLSDAREDAQLSVSGPGAESLLHVRVDGVDIVQKLDPAAGEGTVDLLHGWHLVEVRGAAAAAGDMSFLWTGGTPAPVTADSAFALDTSSVWQHVRAYVPGATVQGATIRYDTVPHLAAFDGMRVGTSINPPVSAVALDTYRSIWAVPTGGSYRILIESPRQEVTLTIDGKRIDAAMGDLYAMDLSLTEGDHTIEIAFKPKGDVAWVGGAMTITDPATGAPVVFEIRPF